METVATNVWQRSKLLVKGLLIGALVLLLLIPAYFVQNVISEREARQKEAFTEVSSKWAGSQNITGPVLVLPYTESFTSATGQTTILKRLAYVLPDKLTIESEVKPEERHRGIFQVMLYSSVIRLNGKFDAIPLQQLKLDPTQVLWNEAYICMELADSKGLKEEIKVAWNDSSVTLNPSMVDNAVMKEGFTAPVAVSADKEIQFSSSIAINGSEQLLFTPVGKETTVKLSSDWPDPSFTGGQLPDHRISDTGFVATWKSLAHTRNFPQAWKESKYNLQSASFGADLFIPVNGYQKTMRSVKYAILCILLTFAAFFIIETVNKKSVHPFQYALIGLALILFYTLLLSFSEYTGFNAAYIIASVATVGLIAWFVKGILQSSKLTTVLGIMLALMYSYVFTILQLQDYSLLLGSIGLFLTLAVIMHFSKKYSGNNLNINFMEFKDWKQYFLLNQNHFAGINSEKYDELTEEDKSAIFSSLQQFQKGESSEGKHLFAFAKQFPDPEYLNCIKLFIREEQRHASVLGSFMHRHKIPLIKGHWVDEVFRWLRKMGGIQNTVRILLIAEIIAKVYYRALYNATGSEFLKRICLQILSDEEKHIEFQCDMAKIFHERQSSIHRFFIRNMQLFLMTGTTLVVWWYHKKVLKRGGYYFGKFFLKHY